VVAAINAALNGSNQPQKLVAFSIVEYLGLDIAVFMQWADKVSTLKLIELKAFTGARPGGIGFDNNKGLRSQVDLLIQPSNKIVISDNLCRWILVDGTRNRGEARYAFFTNS
jgi:hypothetical protein